MKKMTSKDKLLACIDAVGMSVIAVVSLGYLVFWNSFAKISLQLPFLKFPIFIGEILLAFCLVLSVVKWCILKPSVTRWHYVLLIYGLWVLVKALKGYIDYGPLSLRHAAFFYYPLFAVMSCYFFRPGFYAPWLSQLVFLSLFLIKATIGFNDYFLLPTFCIMLFLALKMTNRLVRIFAVVGLLCLFPFAGLFQFTKSFLIGNLVAVVFIGGYLFLLFKLSRWQKGLIFLLLGLGFVYGLLRFTDNGQLTVLTKPGGLWETFRVYDKYIKEQEKGYVPQKLDVQIFHHTRGKPSEILVRLHWKESTTSYLQQAELTKENLYHLRRAVATEIQGFEDQLMMEKMDVKMNGEEAEVLRGILQKSREVLNRIDIAFANISAVISSEDHDGIVGASEEAMVVLTDGKEFLNDLHQIAPTLLDQAKKTSASSELPLKRSSIWERFANMREADRNEINKGGRSIDAQYGNMVFRLLVWRDMIGEYLKEKPLLGFSFGKPQRSISLEITNIAHGEWTRDGWIAPHNAYLHMIYRGGVVGIFLILTILGALAFLTVNFYQVRIMSAGLLLGALVYWLTIANFLMVLEFPYHAIPFWSLFGVTWAYCLQQRKVRHELEK